MSNLSLPSSSSSSSSPQAVETRSKWTVSPEFGDALLTAMRERSQAGGPLPRLPSLLQLSAADGRGTPNSNSSPVKLDGAERLKMKTKVAIRERNHRFQIVPLRDAGHYSSSDQTPLRALKTAVVKTPGVVQSNPRCAWKKLPADENTVPMPTSAGYTQTGTPERARKLSERNKNATSLEHPSFERPAETHYTRHIASESSAHKALSSPGNKPLTETGRHNGTTHRSRLERENYSDCHTLHFKSPSLGDVCMKPDLRLKLEATPVPQVTCRKRTNTLSAAHDRSRGHLPVTIVYDDSQNLVKKDSVKRHAIYTQSLHIPLHERSESNFPLGSVPKISLEESSPLRAFPFRSSIPTSRNKPGSTSRRSGHANSALGFINAPTVSLGFSESTSGSQSSVSSIYSQDELSCPSKAALIETRPLTHLGPLSESGQVARDSRVDETPIQYHPIILMLLDEVEKAKQEWSTI